MELLANEQLVVNLLTGSVVCDHHVEMDWEITLMGNGTNPCEASQAFRLVEHEIKALLSPLGISEVRYAELEKLAAEAAEKQMVSSYGANWRESGW